MTRWNPIYQYVVAIILFAGVVWGTVTVLTLEERAPETESTIAENDPILMPYPDDAYLPKNFAVSEDSPALLSTDVIDVHEHVQFEADGERLLSAMDQSGISRACLLGTPLYTFTLNKQNGFEKLADNNQTILSLKNKYPERFCVFVVIDPNHSDALARMQALVRQGADGVKLYLGHGESHGGGQFHTMPLDDARMLPIYQWAEEVGLPIIYHVNLIKYYDEFDRMMNMFPRLKVNLPHFGLHSNSWARLSALGVLLDRYPNLYFDMSYGWYEFHVQGFENLARNRTMLRAFIERYSDRVLFGADSVVEFTKSVRLLTDKLSSYRQILEQPNFRFYLKPERNLHGLQLSKPVLQKIYKENPTRFLHK